MGEKGNKIFYIDLFSGAGGTTTGVHLAGSEVIACVNHDEKAIESHRANHPECHHFVEDIRDFKVVEGLKVIVEKLRKEVPESILVIWASLECTNFSNAKGGLARDADSRTLANDLFMYLEHLKPEYLMIENVREFMAWGPLDKNGKPKSRLKGKDYIKWIETVKSYGFTYDWRLLNSANFGSYQSRERYFGQFAKKGYPIAWPEPTYAKTPEKHGSMFGCELKKWRPVRDVLDLDDVGESIFKRKKPLVEATLKRIYEGLEKFVANDCPNVKMLTSYYGNGGAHDVGQPCPTVTTKDRFSVVTPQFLDNQYGRGLPTSIEKPSGSVTTNPKQQLVTVNPWIMDTSFSNVGKSIDEPSGTILASRKHHYLMNPQFNDQGRDLERPCFTLIARMDKKPPYLIEAEQIAFSPVEIFEDDSPMTKKIKEFMIQYGIADIKMRMLRIHELLRIQGFPEGYVLIGTQAEQKKFIGNAVDVNASRAIAQANREALAAFLENVA